MFLRFDSAGPNTRRRRRNQALLWVGTILATLSFLAIFNGWATAWGIPTPVQQWTFVLVVLGLVGLTIFQWRELDEVGRQAHTTSFFWAGMIVWPIVLAIVGWSAASGDVPGPSFPVFGSTLMVIGVHAVLYMAFVLVLWLRNRMP